MPGKKKSRENEKATLANNVEIQPDFKNANQSAQRTYFIGTIIGMVLGGLLCAGGFILTILGLTGSIDWIIEFNGVSSRLMNASPGIFFGLLGMILVWRFKPKVTDETKTDRYHRKLTLEMKGSAAISPSESGSGRIKKKPEDKVLTLLSEDHDDIEPDNE